KGALVALVCGVWNPAGIASIAGGFAAAVAAGAAGFGASGAVGARWGAGGPGGGRVRAGTTLFLALAPRYFGAGERGAGARGGAACGSRGRSGAVREGTGADAAVGRVAGRSVGRRRNGDAVLPAILFPTAAGRGVDGVARIHADAAETAGAGRAAAADSVD